MVDPKIGGLESGIKWVALGKLSTQLITWGMTFVVLRLLAPSDYGVVALSMAITSLFGMVAEFGLSSAIVQARTISRQQMSNLFGYGLLVNLLIVGVLLTIAPLVVFFYSDERLPLVIQVASIQFVFSALSLLPDARMRREMRFKLMAKIEFSLGVFAGLSTLLLAYWGFGYWALVASPLLAAFLRMVLLNLTAHEWISPRLSLQDTRGLLKFGGFILLARIAGHFLSQSDVLIAGVFLTKEDLGVYAVAVQLASMPLSKVMMVINQVAYPELSRMYREEGVKGDVLLNGGRLVAYVLFPLLWGLAAVAPFVVQLLMGEKWLGAVIPLQLVCLALPFRAVSTMLTTAVAAVGRPDIELWNTLTGCAIFPFLFYVGVQYGVQGLAWAWIVGTPLFVYLNMVRSGRALGLKSKHVLSSLLLPMTCAGTMYFSLVALRYFGVFQAERVDHLLFSIAIGGAIYVTLLARLDVKSFGFFLMFVGIKNRWA